MFRMSEGIEGELTPGTMVGDHRIVRRLGDGASGAVYEVVKGSVAKRMALKVLHRSLATNDDDLLRFEREAMIAGAIEHPNVLQVFDVGEYEGHYYMTMELLEGETLHDRLAREKTLAVRELADLFVPLMSALGAVHDQGIVHRDLKPGNIFLATKRPGVVEPKILDFGVIKDLTGIVGGDMTRAHAMVGSPSYMSPEQAEQSKAIDVRSDQFTVGAILWECLVGRRCFDADTLYALLFKIAEAKVPAPSSLRPDVPSALDAVILRAMAREPGDRFASVRELGAKLLPFASDHVRTLWREDYAAWIDAETSADAADEDADSVTSVIPPSTRDLVAALRASLVPSEPDAPRTHDAPTIPRISVTPDAPAPVSVPPRERLSTMAAPMHPPVPAPAWVAPTPYAPPAPMYVAPQPPPAPPTMAAPPRSRRTLWVVLATVMAVGAVALTLLTLDALHAARPASTVPAVQAVVARPAAAPIVAPPSTIPAPAAPIVAPSPAPVAPTAPAVSPAPAAPDDDEPADDRPHRRRRSARPKDGPTLP